MLLQTLTSAMFLASIYAMAAFGLVIVFGVLDILNFAHGALLVVSAYLATVLTMAGLPLLAAGAVVVVLMGAAGAALGRGLFQRVEGNVNAGLVLSVGLIAVIDTVILRAWGPEPRSLPRVVEGGVTVGSVSLPADRLVIIAIAIATMTAAQLVITRTRWGKMLRATAQQKEAAALQGIPVARVTTGAFAVGVALAAAAGVLVGSTGQFDAQLGDALIIKAFIVIILGGAGSTLGAMVGAVILGFAEAFSTTFFGIAVAQAVPLLALAVVLVVRPQGLFGRRSVRV